MIKNRYSVERLKEVIEHFNSLESKIHNLTTSPELKSAITRINEGQDLHAVLQDTFWKLDGITIGLGYDKAKKCLYLELVPEHDPNKDDILSEVYRSILLELYQNLPIGGSVVFYPAIGYDWRICEEWKNATIVGIDSNKFTWKRDNANKQSFGYKVAIK